MLVVLALAAAYGLETAPPAQAVTSAQQQLVSAYSPILRLRAQKDPPCDETEEQYQPSAVDAVLGNPRVRLVRIRKGYKTRLITAGPTAADIAGLGSSYYLDLPGDPITSDCLYAKDFAALKKRGKVPAVTYARIASEVGFHGLVVQYWFYYYFNQFNDVHESDWEGMQIAFDASTPEQALAKGPSKVVLFQHAGGETADWEDDKVQKRGTHPIVYPAAGSHATFYDDAVYLQTGQGGSGLGCDNTTEPLRQLTPRPVLVPTAPTRDGPFPWLTYRGQWGQKEKGFNNGPAGPNTKVVWKTPFTWMDSARLASPTLPSGGFLGPAATGVFCGAVATVSVFINAEARSPLGVLLIVAILILLLLLPVVITRWRPVELDNLRQPRRFGQLLRAARQLYGRHWRTFMAIGFCSVIVIAAIEGLQALYTLVTSHRDLNPAFSIGGANFDLSVTVAGALRPLGLTIVAAAAIAAVRLLDRGERPTFAAAWRLTLHRFWRLLLARVLVTVVLGLLFITVIGIPFAIWKFVEWQLVQQEILFEDKSIRAALKGSSRLVRHHWFRTLGIAGFLSLLNAAIGPVLGFALIFANLSLVAVDLTSSLVYALLIPYVAIARTLLYLDLSARKAAKEQEAS